MSACEGNKRAEQARHYGKEENNTETPSSSRDHLAFRKSDHEPDAGKDRAIVR
jgi:hypothetical protein